MAYSTYKCTKCGTNYSSSQRPLNGTCSKGGGHTWWKRPANPKYVNWRCSKCGTSYSSSDHPLKGTCPKGGGHTWRKN